MSSEKIVLNTYAECKYSQFGEDGILEQLFARLGISSGFFVEFGAWDGKHLSNTFYLLEKGWSGLYIEGSPERFEDLKRNVGSRDVYLANRFVSVSGPNTLDNILKDVGAPKDIDILSIDIDSDDLAIFMSVKEARAKCVVIEFNPTIPFDTEFVNKPGRHIGNSALSIKRYAESIGYSLVALTQTNLILLDNALLEEANVQIQSLERTGQFNAYRYFFGFDGTLICHDTRLATDEPEVFTIPWQHYRIQQPIPRMLRVFDHGPAFGAFQVLVSLWTALVTRPALFPRMSAQIFKRMLEKTGEGTQQSE